MQNANYADKTTNLNALAVTEIDKNPSFTLLVGTRHDIITSPYLTLTTTSEFLASTEA